MTRTSKGGSIGKKKFLPPKLQRRGKPKGLHEYRFKGNPDERRFAKAWKTSNELGQTLAYLLCEGDQNHPSTPSDRDQVVAATVIQWLGSPVGQLFLSEQGFVRVPKR